MREMRGIHRSTVGASSRMFLARQPVGKILSKCLLASNVTTELIHSATKMSNLDGFLLRIRECNTGLEELPTLTPFFVEGKEVGKLKPR